MYVRAQEKEGQGKKDRSWIVDGEIFIGKKEMEVE